MLLCAKAFTIALFIIVNGRQKHQTLYMKLHCHNIIKKEKFAKQGHNYELSNKFAAVNACHGINMLN